nr:hypothetical protein [Streptomyces sp. NRRL F-2747]
MHLATTASPVVAVKRAGPANRGTGGGLQGDRVQAWENQGGDNLAP